MSIVYNPSVVTDGLVFCLDAANQKSYSYSENLLNTSTPGGAYWQTSLYATAVANAVMAPDGTMTGVRLVENSRNDYQVFYSTAPANVVPNMYYTNSIYLKAAGRNYAVIYAGGSSAWSAGGTPNARIDLTNGTLIAGSNNYPVTITPAANGWYRVSSYGQANSTGTGGGVISLNVGALANNTTGAVYQGDGTSGIYVWGAQIQTGNVVTALTQTTTTPVAMSTTANDLSGYNNFGTFANNVTYSPTNGGAFVFDGVDDYISVTENANMTPQVLTFEVALKINSFTNISYGGASNTQQYILLRQNTRIGGFEGYTIVYDETNTRFFMTATPSGGTQYNLYGSANIVANTPYIVTGVFDSTLMSLYVNGVLQTTAAKASGIDYNVGHTLKLGRSVANGTTWDTAFNGNIYYAKMYNRVLSPNEIKQNFNATRGRFGI